MPEADASLAAEKEEGWEMVETEQQRGSNSSSSSSSALLIPAQEPLRGSELGTSRAPGKVVFNFAFSRRLNFLQYCAMETQYQLAYLSTMGGACHLTNNIDRALVIAKQQESIAERLGSLEIKIRSRVFQAVNLGMKGDESTCKSILRECTKLATSNKWTGMGVFVKNSETWLVMNKHISAAAEEQPTLDDVR